MKFKFQSFFDVQTNTSSMQVLQWSVGGAEVIQRCSHLFGAYKFFKLGKISVKFQPISTLPVDPQGLSYDVDDPLTVDPRDQANLGLVRITNGEDVFTNVSMLTAQQQEQAYYSMMLDPRWSKFSLQSGFRRSAYPLYWQIGQLHQDVWPGSTINVPLQTANGVLTELPTGTNATQLIYGGSGYSFQTKIREDSSIVGSSARGMFQVGHRGRLGFLPTDYYQEYLSANGGKIAYGANNVPEVSVITAILPKAFKTVYYYRVYVTEEVIFSGIRSSPPIFPSGGQYLRTSGFDNFLQGTFGRVNPTETQDVSLVIPTDRRQNNGSEMP